MPLRERINFAGEGAELIGNLFLPDPASTGDATALQGVVVAGTWTSVKEQMADPYAEALARRGPHWR
ncbi:hypothetical protein ACFYMW_10820 [Streptomyces sp. NPDC006692]|uniref:hypothetical protein n=1 Tax=unclassified Streptomyces TaxID=2593676 RepID=UPI0036C8C1F4